MEKLYQEQLMDHYRHPRNKGELAGANFVSKLQNPSCGDSVSFQACFEQNKLVKIAFTGVGCVISLGTASMLSEQVAGKTIEEIVKLDKDFVLRMIGIQLGPTRLRCALLPLQALQDGIRDYLKQAK